MIPIFRHAMISKNENGMTRTVLCGIIDSLQDCRQRRIHFAEFRVHVLIVRSIRMADMVDTEKVND